MIKKLAIALLALAGIISLAAGITGLLSTEFTPYNAVVAEKSWSQIDGGVQSVILGMQKIMGGGFLATGLAILAFLIPVSRGEPWAQWATLVVTAAFWLPTLYVAVSSRSIAPEAETPVLPTIVVIALVSAGIGVIFLARNRQ